SADGAGEPGGPGPRALRAPAALPLGRWRAASLPGSDARRRGVCRPPFLGRTPPSRRLGGVGSVPVARGVEPVGGDGGGASRASGRSRSVARAARRRPVVRILRADAPARRSTALVEAGDRGSRSLGR